MNRSFFIEGKVMQSNESLLKKGEVSQMILCACCDFSFIYSLAYPGFFVIELRHAKSCVVVIHLVYTQNRFSENFAHVLNE